MFHRHEEYDGDFTDTLSGLDAGRQQTYMRWEHVNARRTTAREERWTEELTGGRREEEEEEVQPTYLQLGCNISAPH